MSVESPNPQIFAPGSVSTSAPEFSTTFSPDGRTVYFNRASADRSTIRIFRSAFAEGAWAEAEPVAFSDGTYRDVDPFVSRDGSRLYFSSNRPTDGDSPKDDYDIWYVDQSADGWGDPVNVGPPLNGPDSEIFVSATADGVLYFAVYDDDGSRIVRAAPGASGFERPRTVALGLPVSADVGNPLIARDESYLIFVSSTLADSTGADLYISRKGASSEWEEPTPLSGAVNSAYADFAPAFSPDGRYLFFTSERPGMVPAPAEGRPPGDIYQVPVAYMQ
jgi:hypothetical protein